MPLISRTGIRTNISDNEIRVGSCCCVFLISASKQLWLHMNARMDFIMAQLNKVLITLLLLAFVSQARGQEDFFEKNVRPVLANNCYPCHGPLSGVGQASLRLDSLEGMLRGGRSGPAITPGDSSSSLLIHAVKHDTFVQMPPKKKLPRAEIEALTRWVELGASWPNSLLTEPVKEKIELASQDSIRSKNQTT